MDRLSRRIAAVAGFLCFQAVAAAAFITGVTVDPPYPTSRDAVKLTLNGQGPLCAEPTIVTVTNPPDFLSAGTIKLRVVPCPVDPPPPNAPFAQTVVVGPLPQGSYDVKTEDGLFTARFDVSDVHQLPIESLFFAFGRFEVSVAWRSAAAAGIGLPEALTNDAGYFWFFDPTNPELLVKVIDGTAVNGRFWVFLGGLSDVDYTVTVTDHLAGKVRTYANPRGTVASRADTSAF